MAKILFFLFCPIKKSSGMRFTITFEDDLPAFDQIHISLQQGESKEYVIDKAFLTIFKASDVSFLASGSYGNVFALTFPTGHSVAAKIVTADDYEIQLLTGMKENTCKQLLPYYIVPKTFLKQLKIIFLPLMDGTIRELALDAGISLPHLFQMATLWCNDLQCMIDNHQLYYTDINYTNIMYKKMRKSGNIFVQFVDYGSLIEAGKQPWGVYVLPNRNKRDAVMEVDVVWPMLVTLAELYAVQRESVAKVERVVFKMRSTRWTKKNMNNFTSMLPPSLRQLLEDVIDGKLTTLSELQQRCAALAKKQGDKRKRRKRKRGDEVEVEWRHDSRPEYQSFVGKRYKATLLREMPRAWVVQWLDGSQSRMPKSWIY